MKIMIGKISRNLSANAMLSHYRILSKIGAGGMGEVYLAEDTKLERRVALKILPENFAGDAERMRRFVQEAKAASALNHPNILTIHEIGETTGTHYIATEFIEGETLRHHLEDSRLKIREVLEVTAQVASALSTAHQAGIIHRDIKPENIMLRPDGYVKVLDFGLAKLTEKRPLSTDSDAATISRKATDPGTVMGTVQYMSPEQARGKEVDARTDIFSLGMVLYEMVAGRPPFSGESSMDVLAAILEKEPPLLARFADDVPQELQRIVTKCLRKACDERYQTMKDVLLDVKELRDELALEAKLERSIRPASNSAEHQQTLIADGGITQNQGAQATKATSAQTRSSAEYVVSEIRQHKRGVAIVLLGLLMAASGLAYWYFSNRSSSARPIESIAVMPFVNESGNADVEYLSDGMTETLISSLSRLPNLAVKSRSTVFYYKGKESSPKKIGEELKVQAVLLGRVVQRGDRMRLNLELVNTNTQDVIWSEQYDRKQSELVSLQSEIAKDVSTKLKTKLSGADEARVTKSYTTDSEAYQLYLKGRFHWNKRTYDDLLKAIEHFKAAVEKDDGFALAYSGLADSYSILPYYRGAKSSEFMKQAKPYAIRAVEMDDQLAEAHTALAFVNEGTWNWGEAEKEYQRAIELNPNYPTAQMRYARFEVRARRRDGEGLTRMKHALELEPSSLVINDNLSQVYLAQGDADSALEQAKRTVELDPRFSFGWVDLTYAYLKKGQKAEALAAANTVVDVAKRSSRSLICLGFVNAVLGRRSEAMAVLKELEAKYQNGQSDAAEVAAVYVGLGDKDQAFIWLDKAFADRSSLLVDLRAEFPFASLRDDPRYQDLLKRMGLPK